MGRRSLDAKSLVGNRPRAGKISEYTQGRKVSGMEIRRDKYTDAELSENAVAVLKKRYLKKNKRGEAVEEPIDMFRRVAANRASPRGAAGDAVFALLTLSGG